MTNNGVKLEGTRRPPIYCPTEDKIFYLDLDTIEARLDYAVSLSEHGHNCNDDLAKRLSLEVIYEIQNIDFQRFWKDKTIQGALSQSLRGERVCLATAPCEEHFCAAIRLLRARNSRDRKQARFSLALSFITSPKGTELLLQQQLARMGQPDADILSSLAAEARQDAQRSTHSTRQSWDELRSIKSNLFHLDTHSIGLGQ